MLPVLRQISSSLRILGATAIAGLNLYAQKAGVSALDGAHAAPLNEVRLLEGPFAQAQEWDHQYMLKLDPDRLLAPFRREAGMPKKADPYGNWESEGLDGHTAGHYLSALSFMYASTGDPELLKRLNYMVDELAQVQKANGDGYVGGVPGSKQFWAEIASGNVGAIRSKWVPWYNVHKTFAGLRDAWMVCGNAQAKTVLIGLADWTGNITAKLSDAQMQQMLEVEQGGMNEVLADVYEITGDKKYLDLGERFDHQAILKSLEAHQDRLDGLHANTQIPKVIGFQRIGELSDDSSMIEAAEFFWERVTQARSVAIGGNSTQEHFNPSDNFSSMLQNREGPETCNSYNMLRLTQALFDAAPKASYFDFAERVLYNHILTTIDQHGLVYFTPMRPGHYRTYSTAGESFWCCVGTGMENHGKYGGFIYSMAPDALYVNLFIPSVLTWREQGTTIRQETQFPEEPKSHFVISNSKPAKFTLNIRHPAWVKKGEFKILVNGVSQGDNSEPSTYVAITRTWQSGDAIDVSLPMHTSYERFPDGMDDVAFLKGPLVLASSLGHEDMPDLYAADGRWDHISERGALLPLDAAPFLVCANDAILESLRPVEGKSLTFTLGKSLLPEKYQSLELVPFYKLPDLRYVIYWQHLDPDTYRDKIDALHKEEAITVALIKNTIDDVLPGQQQPEVDHNFQGQGCNQGYFKERHWRDATGWFSYDLKAVPGQDAELAVTYWGGDRGRQFSISVNGQGVANVDLEGEKPAQFYTVTYPLPKTLLAAASQGLLTVKFAASPGSRAGGVFDVRLVKTELGDAVQSQANP